MTHSKSFKSRERVPCGVARKLSGFVQNKISLMNIILEFGFFLLYSSKQSQITQPLDICVNESLIELQSGGQCLLLTQ